MRIKQCTEVLLQYFTSTQHAASYLFAKVHMGMNQTQYRLLRNLALMPGQAE